MHQLEKLGVLEHTILNLTKYSGCEVSFIFHTFTQRICRSRDRMVVGFSTTCAVSAYHHWCCEVESRSGWGVQHYVIVCQWLQVSGFLQVLRFPPPIKLPAKI